LQSLSCAGVTVLIFANVPTGIKRGVCTTPWGVWNCPTLASVWLHRRSNLKVKLFRAYNPKFMYTAFFKQVLGSPPKAGNPTLVPHLLEKRYRFIQSLIVSHSLILIMFSFSAILIIQINFLKARHRRAFKKSILVFPAPKALETPKSVS